MKPPVPAAALLLVPLACRGPHEGNGDRDGDGWTATDCDDSDPSVHPHAEERFDWVDQDCDGSLGTWSAGMAHLQVAGAERPADPGSGEWLGLARLDGDVDGDGRADLVIGSAYGMDELAPDEEGGDYLGSGALYVFATTGKMSGELADATEPDPDRVHPVSGADRTVRGLAESGLGRSVDLVPGWAADGTSAILAGAPFAVLGGSWREGTAHLLAWDDLPQDGPLDLGDPPAGADFATWWDGTGDWCYYGNTVASAGVWPDGHAWAAVGLFGTEGLGDGDVDLVDLTAAAEAGGPAGPAAGLPGLRLRGGQDVCWLGHYRLSLVGDLTGDGVPDLGVESSAAPCTVSTDFKGRVYVVDGAEVAGVYGGGTIGDNSLDIADVAVSLEADPQGADPQGPYGEIRPKRLGYDFAGGADFDGDGYGDLAVGAPGAYFGEEDSVGAVFLGLGPLDAGAGGSLGLWDWASVAWTGETESSMAGKAVVVADFDGNGAPEVAVGAPLAAVDEDGDGHCECNGKVYVLAADQVLDGGSLGDASLVLYGCGEFGSPIASGDVDADGRADLAIGEMWMNFDDIQHAGRVYLLLGRLWGE